MRDTKQTTTNASAATTAQGLSGYDSIRLTEMIARSQDGNPISQLREEMHDGRLIGVTDNLNRLLADAINNAVESGDLDTLAQDLEYAANQLKEAHRYLIENTYCPCKRKGFGTVTGERTILP